LSRALGKDVYYANGEIAIPHESSVEQALQWFYSTECDFVDDTGRRCARQVVAEYFVWDTVYYALKDRADKYANDKLNEKDSRYRIFLDHICNTSSIELEGKTKPNNQKDKMPCSWRSASIS